ncbi:MAG: PAS domain S-box protein [Bacteroidota bacterium]
MKERETNLPGIITGISGLLVSLAGLTVTLGWFIGSEGLKTLFTGFDPMMINTSACFFFAGIALLLSAGRRPGKTAILLVRACALVMFIFGIVTLAEYLLHTDTGINELFIRDQYIRTGFSGRHMAVSSAIAFTCSAIALFNVHAGGRLFFSVAHVFSFMAGLISSVTIVGYLYNVGEQYYIGPFSTMTLTSAGLFFILVCGTFSIHPERGLFGSLSGIDNSKKIARMLLPAAIVIPLVIGYLVLLGEKSGMFNMASGEAITAILVMLFATTLILLATRWLQRAEQKVSLIHETLKKSEEHFRELFDHMTEGFAYHRMLFNEGKPYDYIYLEVNEAFRRLTGLRDVEGKRASEVIPGILLDNTDIFEHYLVVAGSGTSTRFETYSPGLKAWYSVYIYCMDKEHFVTVIDDVTRRKETEVAVRENEEKLRTLFDILPAGVSYHDNQTRILNSNKAFFRILSASETSILDGTHRKREFIHTDGSPLRQDEWPLTRAIKEKVAIHNEEIGIRSEDGETRWVNVNISPVSVGNIGAVAVLTDITAQKNTERALQASQDELRETLSQLTDVEDKIKRKAAIELHDQVGQNLTALIINMNYLKSQINSEANTRLIKFLDDSLTLLEDTITRTRDIMTELRPAVLEDYGLYPALQWYAAQFADRTGLHIDILGEDLHVQLPRRVEYAMFRVAQEAFTNIAKHAQARNIRIILAEAEHQVTLEIDDDGIGFDSEGLRTKDKPTLGVTVMKERAKASGGLFKITSLPGKGTSVTFRITR